MKIKINTQQYNSLLKRKEVIFEAEHELREGTPTRAELRKKLAEILKTNIELVFVKRAITKTGTLVTVGEANIYDTPEQAKKVEAKHIIERNISSAKPKEETVTASGEAKPKEETAKKTKEA